MLPNLAWLGGRKLVYSGELKGVQVRTTLVAKGRNGLERGPVRVGLSGMIDRESCTKVGSRRRARRGRPPLAAVLPEPHRHCACRPDIIRPWGGAMTFGSRTCARAPTSRARADRERPAHACLDGPAGTPCRRPSWSHPRLLRDRQRQHLRRVRDLPHLRPLDAGTRQAAAASSAPQAGAKSRSAPNLTTLNFALSRALVRHGPWRRDRVTQLDHGANRGPWLNLRRGIVVRRWPCARTAPSTWGPGAAGHGRPTAGPGARLERPGHRERPGPRPQADPR